MWQIMYEKVHRDSGLKVIRFIPLDFHNLTREDEDGEANNVAALVWYGFCLGRGPDNLVLVTAVTAPELVWREPIDFHVTDPPAEKVSSGS